MPILLRPPLLPIRPNNSPMETRKYLIRLTPTDTDTPVNLSQIPQFKQITIAYIANHATATATSTR